MRCRKRSDDVSSAAVGEGAAPSARQAGPTNPPLGFSGAEGIGLRKLKSLNCLSGKKQPNIEGASNPASCIRNDPRMEESPHEGASQPHFSFPPERIGLRIIDSIKKSRQHNPGETLPAKVGIRSRSCGVRAESV